MVDKQSKAQGLSLSTLTHRVAISHSNGGNNGKSLKLLKKPSKFSNLYHYSYIDKNFRPNANQATQKIRSKNNSKNQIYIKRKSKGKSKQNREDLAVDRLSESSAVVVIWLGSSAMVVAQLGASWRNGRWVIGVVRAIWWIETALYLLAGDGQTGAFVASGWLSMGWREGGKGGKLLEAKIVWEKLKW